MFAGAGQNGAVLDRPKIHYDNFEEYKIEHKLMKQVLGPGLNFQYILEDDGVNMSDMEFQIVGARGQLEWERKHS